VAGFIYYVAGAQTMGQARETIEREGARGLAEGAAHVHSAAGPDSHGLLIIADANGGAKASPEYTPGKQTWKKAGRRLWVGFETARRPRPEELLRRNPIEGRPVAMGDGNDWLVPIARRCVGGPDGAAWLMALPRAHRFEKGSWSPGEVLGRYRALWQRVEQYAGALVELGKGDPAAGELVSFEDENETIVEALAVNYRLGRHEVSALGLVTSEVVGPVIRVLCDLDALEELGKKGEAPGGACTSPGAAG
jgi:hypothetical protein